VPANPHPDTESYPNSKPGTGTAAAVDPDDALTVTVPAVVPRASRTTTGDGVGEDGVCAGVGTTSNPPSTAEATADDPGDD